jgi:hypothetical protein
LTRRDVPLHGVGYIEGAMRSAMEAVDAVRAV